MRMVDRVHRNAPDTRPLALPAVTPGLSPVDVGLLGVSDLADRCAAAYVDHTHLPGRHAQRGIPALASDQLDARPGRAGELGAAARPKFHRVDRGTERDVAQRQVVARLDIGALAGFDLAALAESLRGDDVSLLTVGEMQQGNPGGAVRVVLDVSNLGGHAVLVIALEVDQPVGLLVTAA